MDLDSDLLVILSQVLGMWGRSTVLRAIPGEVPHVPTVEAPGERSLLAWLARYLWREHSCFETHQPLSMLLLGIKESTHRCDLLLAHDLHLFHLFGQELLKGGGDDARCRSGGLWLLHRC